MKISTALKTATQDLVNKSDSARLDAEVLLASVLDVTKAYLYTWPEREVNSYALEKFKQLLQRRQRGEPIAYLLGEREFWSLALQVTPDTLIPRPETELLVELVLAYLPNNEEQHILELGTGSGAIALALASQCPAWQVTATDKSNAALAVAEQNAKNCQIKSVNWRLSDWFTELFQERFHLIVSNPPYIATGDPHLSQGDLPFEPKSALIAGPDGLEAIRYITHRAQEYLLPQGYLMLEHGYEQAKAVTGLMKECGFVDVKTERDIGGQMRVTTGRIRGTC